MIRKDNPLISIIVPVYKVEQYLDDCIISIVNQTYTNTEIILVDDGSPDNCPSICDDWVKKDSRIQVIHKKNGGLSSARNAGLSIAQGVYIGFVDSDDFVDKYMYEKLLDGFSYIDNVALVSGLIYSYNNGRFSDFKKEWLITTNNIITADDFCGCMVLEKNSYTVWNKLFRADVIRSVLFKEGRNNEDILFLYDLSKVIKRHSLIALEIPYRLYFYRLRPDSICTTTKVPLQIDMIDNLIYMMNDCYHTDRALYHDIYFKYVSSIYHFLDRMLINRAWELAYFKKYQKNLKEIDFLYIKKNFYWKDQFWIWLICNFFLVRKGILKVKKIFSKIN